MAALQKIGKNMASSAVRHAPMMAMPVGGFMNTTNVAPSVGYTYTSQALGIV